MGRAWRLAAVWVVLAGLLVLSPAGPAQAAGVVGDGTAGSYDEAVLNDALMGGGPVTFNCGAAPVTIIVTGQKVIAADTQIDGVGWCPSVAGTRPVSSLSTPASRWS